MLLQETYPCQDIFIIGGQSDGKSPIDITINSMPEQWNSYNSWMIGDNYLDWDGTEADQGTFNGYEASGTAAAFTSNDPSDKFYFELNDFGSNYWVVDMDLDCDQTQEKWFEFKTILRHCVGGIYQFVSYPWLQIIIQVINHNLGCFREIGFTEKLLSSNNYARRRAKNIA